MVRLVLGLYNKDSHTHESWHSSQAFKKASEFYERKLMNLKRKCMLPIKDGIFTLALQ